MSQRTELQRIIADALGDSNNGNLSKDVAEAILNAGYVLADHVEYAADHKFSGIEFHDEDGDLWTDEEDFREFFGDYTSTTLVQRHVTDWEPLP